MIEIETITIFISKIKEIPENSFQSLLGQKKETQDS
jgi:hypothetical protein